MLDFAEHRAFLCMMIGKVGLYSLMGEMSQEIADANQDKAEATKALSSAKYAQISRRM